MTKTAAHVSQKDFLLRTSSKGALQFSAFVSDLYDEQKNPPFHLTTEGMGMTLLTKKGNEIEYVIVHREKDHEGDLVSWTLKPTQASIGRIPVCEGSEVLIWND